MHFYIPVCNLSESVVVNGIISDGNVILGVNVGGGLCWGPQLLGFVSNKHAFVLTIEVVAFHSLYDCKSCSCV